jgi:hypothetical protein
MVLMLFLFSEIRNRDAPTRIAQAPTSVSLPFWAPSGERGMSSMELGIAAASATEGCRKFWRAGRGRDGISVSSFSGTLRTTSPRQHPAFYGSPCLFPRVPFELDRKDGNYSLTEEAIRAGLRARTLGEMRTEAAMLWTIFRPRLSRTTNRYRSTTVLPKIAVALSNTN